MGQAVIAVSNPAWFSAESTTISRLPDTSHQANPRNGLTRVSWLHPTHRNDRHWPCCRLTPLDTRCVQGWLQGGVTLQTTASAPTFLLVNLGEAYLPTNSNSQLIPPSFVKETSIYFPHSVMQFPTYTPSSSYIGCLTRKEGTPPWVLKT